VTWPLLAIAVMAIAAVHIPAGAQEMEPRAYSPTPVGMTFLGVSWQRSTGGVTTDPTLPISNVDADMDSSPQVLVNGGYHADPPSDPLKI
jgi:hypothetical protein